MGPHSPSHSCFQFNYNPETVDRDQPLGTIMLILRQTFIFHSQVIGFVESLQQSQKKSAMNFNSSPTLMTNVWDLILK